MRWEGTEEVVEHAAVLEDDCSERGIELLAWRE